MASGAEGFNLDSHAIRHHGDDTVLEKHYVPRRSQRTRAVLTFFAQDHASTEMVYANAEITKAEPRLRRLLAGRHRRKPGLLVFDSQLTTYTVLNELTDRSIGWLTLRQTRQNRNRAPGSTTGQPMEDRHYHPLRALPAPTTARRHDQAQRRRHQGQIAVRNIGRDEPTLLITNNLTTAAKDLFARYAERMSIENELDAYISGFHLDALSSGVPLNVDLDTTLTVVAGNL